MATNVKMMDLRNQPGTWIDRVFYRNESFIVEKQGKPRAVLVPIGEYEEMQRRKQEAREQFWQMTEEIQAAFKDVDPEELEREINAAIKDVRAKKARP